MAIVVSFSDIVLDLRQLQATKRTTMTKRDSITHFLVEKYADIVIITAAEQQPYLRLISIIQLLAA